MIQNGAILSILAGKVTTPVLFRLLAHCPLTDRAVLIEITSGPRKREGSKQPNYYCPGFVEKTWSKLLQEIDEGTIRETTIALPGWWNWSDDDIRKSYPPRDADKDSPMLESRESKLKLIQPLIKRAEEEDVDVFLQLDREATRLARQLNEHPVKMKDALHRYLAFGSVPNALLSNTPRQGAPGKPRIANEKKLGRKNAAAKAGNEALAGKALTWEDRQNLADGWLLFMRSGTNREEAYLATMGVFYSSGYELKHGVWTPNLLPAEVRPTYANFVYHGPKNDEQLAAARRLMGEGKWERDYRPLIGSATDGIVAAGQVGSIDASPIDVNLNAIFSRICPIGVGRGILVRDVRTGIYCGWHIAIGGVSTADANLAILCAATDKTELLKRYDLPYLDPQAFPPLFFQKLYSDNGELRSIEGIDANVKTLGGSIEFVQSTRADRNSVSESGHHQRHRRLDHHLEGATFGRAARRGEVLPIKNALLTRFEYVRLLLRWMYWANTQQRVPHLLTTEMLRANVEPTRIAIFRWYENNRLVRRRRIDPVLLQAKLLPSFTASVQRNGLVLHRPGTGKAVELLPHAQFNDSYLATSGLIRRALSGGNKHVTVKAHPEDLSKAYLLDIHGVHELKNTSDDVIMIHEGSIPDLCALRDSNRLQTVQTASKIDQDLSDMRAYREEEQERARQERKREQMQQAVQKKPSTDRSSVRKNQAEEKRRSLEIAAERTVNNREIDEPARSSASHAAHAPTDDTSSAARTGEAIKPELNLSNVIPLDRQQVLRKRLSQYHRSRK
ncbi:MAG TPA: hypothetical protein VJ698_11385 [Noviherbaspirillum sp.]|uniref:hypothetical protein n=1 Tax=Noviherbaspirillum sp. TaxID=1926288 RepID=UPI002B4730DB|nr:hypothetical protein [Noviherbaspirillum sp.]HJV86066.1 hypothetical protein [Noviherbaspirillum sp.]